MRVSPSTGRRITRVNDARLLRGDGRFLDDIVLPGMLHAAILRSPVAHGRLGPQLDTSALSSPTELVLGPEQLQARAPGSIAVLWHLPGQFQHRRALLDDVVRFVGQPVGIVVADSRYRAEDALEEISADIEELPVVVDPLDALRLDAPLLYPDAGTNVLAQFDVGDSAVHTDAVFASSDRVISTTVRIGRIAGAPMECRGTVAVPDRGTGKLTVWTSTQAPHAVRDTIHDVLGIAQRNIRVIAPDVGGGFGVKDHIYEDELFVCIAALELGRPVKWVEDRYESLLTTHQARDEVHDVDVAFDLDGRLRGLRVRAVRNNGAYLSTFGGGPLFTMAGTLPGPYRWDAVRVECRVVATNLVPVGAYRGFGQTQSTFVRERAVELVARDLGMDPVSIRLANMIPAADQPYTVRTGITYDNGDYPANLARAAELARAWPPGPDDGRRRGVGYGCYVQMAAVGPSVDNRAVGVEVGGWEQATVRMESDATVRLIVGVTPQGQGHETTFAQLCADRLGVSVSSVELLHSDTEFTPYSAYGTAASRSIAVGGGATIKATEKLATKLRLIAASLLEAAPEDIVLGDGRATVAGTAVSISLVKVAQRAWQGWELPDGLDPGLMETATYDPEAFTYSYATHVCRAAVDSDTGAVEIERYAVVHDCGTMVNPTIVEGQIIGGIAQGLGAALVEESVIGPDGQPRSTTLLDYLVPEAWSSPMVDIEHTETPSPFTPGGMKGMGEGGTNGAFACVVNAVAAALPEVADRIVATPLSPSVLWGLLAGVSPP
jgi:aerobic carbon-monoxide dehydrogenase large subunit